MKITTNDSEKAEKQFTNMTEVFNKTNKIKYNTKENVLNEFLNIAAVSKQIKNLAYIG